MTTTMCAATPTVRIESGAAAATPTCAATRCDNPSPSGVVCFSCLSNTRRDLRELVGAPIEAVMLWRADEQRAADERRGLLAELQITLTRQDVTGGEAIPEPPEESRDDDGPSAAETVLLFRPHAVNVARRLHTVLELWTRTLLDTHGIDPVDAFGQPAPWGTPGPTRWTVEYAAWLDRHPDGIASHLDAGALVDHIRGAVEDARRVVFPRRMSYCGPCDCGEQLYAPVGSGTVRCRVCRAQHVVADRLPALRQRAEGTHLAADDMADVLPRIAADIPLRPLTAAQIRGFAHRGRLPQWGAAGHPTYKVGEVITLMKNLLDEQVARDARRAEATSATTRDRVLAAHAKLREALRS